MYILSISFYLLGGDGRSGGSQKGSAEEREGKEGEGALEHHGCLVVLVVVVVVAVVLLCVDMCVCYVWMIMMRALSQKKWEQCVLCLHTTPRRRWV